MCEREGLADVRRLPLQLLLVRLRLAQHWQQTLAAGRRDRRLILGVSVTGAVSSNVQASLSLITLFWLIVFRGEYRVPPAS